MSTQYLRVLRVAALVATQWLTCSVSIASQVYLVQLLPAIGDTIGIGDLSDGGHVLTVGYGDAGIGSGVISPPTYIDHSQPRYGSLPVRLENPYSRSNPGSIGFDSGVQASQINRAGDVLGKVWTGKGTGTGASYVPTYEPVLWINREPYVLADPANAGLSFQPDPGPAQAQFVYEVLRPYLIYSDRFLIDLLDSIYSYGSPFAPSTHTIFAFTNTAGQFAWQTYRPLDHGFILTPVSAPETLSVVLVGLALMALTRRRILGSQQLSRCKRMPHG